MMNENFEDECDNNFLLSSDKRKGSDQVGELFNKKWEMLVASTVCVTWDTG